MHRYKKNLSSDKLLEWDGLLETTDSRLNKYLDNSYIFVYLHQSSQHSQDPVF